MIRANLIRSVTEEVLWHATAERLVAQGLDRIVEFGGSAVLAPLMRRVANAPPATFVGDDKALDALRSGLTASVPS
jgi:malonyl CoA-acyl carrier protein transacylase